ncbi:Ankyrin repeat and KH domain-containing protein mask [Fusarium oxysporum f. sp. rapae]|uniref:Ankyrin repeat and KH domain-containing protein mask n=1 Tax=Fusarium oxysporum f. sp. rapae TaxID=485398 RepID=A0A8J5NHK0_FUSOX|nr:Ankyrin repeat and KH domain-containing protein mask [Fusarium oxysporum f. sp. rapae]
MSLPHLPVELLWYTAENLESEKDINAFSQANRMLHDKLNTYLYQRNIKQSGSSGLLWIARHGRLEEAKILLGEAAKIQIPSSAFPIALLLAADKGSEDMVKLLLEHGVDVNASVEELYALQEAHVKELYGTALLGASAGGHEQIARLLLDNSADVNTQGGDYGTALQGASAGGHEQIVKLLLDNGTDVNR